MSTLLFLTGCGCGALLATLLMILFLILGVRKMRAQETRATAETLDLLRLRNDIQEGQLEMARKTADGVGVLAFWADRYAKAAMGQPPAGIKEATQRGPGADPKAGGAR